jgi:hypothetical protein
MDCVPGVAQKLFARRVPQLLNSLQLPPHPPRSQNVTSPVAERQLVLGAARQTLLPEETVQGPVQMVPERVLQYVTVIVKALRGERVPNGSPMIVMFAGS